MEHNLSRTVSIAKFYEIKKFQRISTQLDEIFLLTNLILILTIFPILRFFCYLMNMFDHDEWNMCQKLLFLII